MEHLSNYYVYRYTNNSEIIYIGITDDLYRRKNEHKRKDTWYHDELRYESIEVDNKFIAKLYEEYLINRDNPQGNRASKNNYNVADIKFNIEEIWMPVVINESGNKAKIQKCNEKNVNKTNKAVVIKGQIQEADDKFIKLVSKYKNEIIKVYYDEHEFLTVILKCSQFKELLSLKYMPSCVIGITFKQSSGIVVVKFNKKENLEKECKEKYTKIYEILNINKLNLDVSYGKNLLSLEMNNVEEKYMNYIDNKYQIILIRIKDDFEINIPIDVIPKLFGGLEFVYRLPFAFGLKYKDNLNMLLIHYEHIRYNEIFNQALKEKFKYQYYVKTTNDKELIEYILYKHRIPNKMLSGYEEYDKEYGVFYQRRENILRVNIAESIIDRELSEGKRE